MSSAFLLTLQLSPRQPVSKNSLNLILLNPHYSLVYLAGLSLLSVYLKL